jgi:hypothetical protein
MATGETGYSDLAYDRMSAHCHPVQARRVRCHGFRPGPAAPGGPIIREPGRA